MTQPDPVSAEPSLPALVPAGDAAKALAVLGITVEEVHGALLSGEQAAASTTEYHPSISPGVLRWIETVATFRRLKVENDDWILREPANSPRVVAPDEQVSVMVITGNSLTGTSRTPSTRHKKGPSTARAVSENQNQLVFELEFQVDSSGEISDAVGPLTWVMLYYRASDPNETRVEVSLPRTISEGRISAWKHRIILPPLSHELSLPEGERDDDIDFPIISRGR